MLYRGIDKIFDPEVRKAAAASSLLIGLGGMAFWGAAIAFDGGSEPVVDGATVLEVNDEYDWGSESERKFFLASALIASVSVVSLINVDQNEQTYDRSYQPKHLRV